MNRLLWITLLVIGLSGCSEESSSSEENTESGTIQDGDHTDNATVIQLNLSEQYQTVEGWVGEWPIMRAGIVNTPIKKNCLI